MCDAILKLSTEFWQKWLESGLRAINFSHTHTYKLLTMLSDWYDSQINIVKWSPAYAKLFIPAYF